MRTFRPSDIRSSDSLQLCYPLSTFGFPLKHYELNSYAPFSTADWIVAVTAVCLLFSEPTVAVYSFSVFLKAVSQDFHASRGAVSFAFTIHNLCAAAISPFVGRLINRFGIRRVLLPSALLVGLVIISAKWIGSGLSHYYLFYLVMGCIGPGTGVVPYSTPSSYRWFDRHRGLALGLMSLGSGIAAMLYPPIAPATHRTLRLAFKLCNIRHRHTRHSFSRLVALSQGRSPREMGLFPDGIVPSHPQATTDRKVTGLVWSQIWTTDTFWPSRLCFFLAGASAHACVLHLAAMLSDRGASASAAANAPLPSSA